MTAPGRAPPAALVAAVQRNCDIADAAHATELSLCNFLLQMREYYRWQQRLDFDARLDRAAVGRWLAEAEDRWAALEGQGFEPLVLDDAEYDPFDAEALNRRLMPQGWVYGAGLAGPSRPGFFLAELERVEACEGGLAVQHCGREHARGLFAPPAALQGRTIVLRRESLARWLWERYETFSLRRGEGPFHAVAEAYGLHDTAAFMAALPRFVDEQAQAVLLHEIGEHRVAQALEPGWAALRMAVRDRRAALMLPAVRDQLADLRHTLPTLLAQGSAVALHFWFAHYEGLRAALFPSLVEAYEAWREGDDGRALRAACTRGAAHFEALALELLRLRDATAVTQRLAEPSCICPPA